MEMKYSKWFTLVYLLLLIGVIIARIMDITYLEYICKPSLMIVLGIFFYVNVKTYFGTIAKLILLALFFSWGGDVFLMFQPQGEHFFLLGLVSFLLAHIVYIVAFSKTNRPQKRSRLSRYPWLVLPFIVFEISFLYLLKDHLGEMLIPVVIYASVITLMAIASIYRFAKVPQASFWLVCIGAITFLTSDSIIALNKFLQPISFAGAWIMITYCIAQYLIVWGIYKQLDAKHQEKLAKL